MAEAANTPEKETETVAVEGMVSLPASVPASVPAVNPKSPVEVREDQVDTEVDLTVQEPPEKRARKSLEDELGKLMERTREGYDLTAAALEKVQQHLDISRQLGKDLTQLAQEVHCGQSWSQISVGPTSAGTQFIPKPGMASWRLQTGVQHQYQSHCKQTFYHHRLLHHQQHRRWHHLRQ